MGSDLVLIIVGALLLLDGLFVFVFPGWTKKFLRKFSKEKVVRMVAAWEIVVAIILFLVVYLI